MLHGERDLILPIARYCKTHRDAARARPSLRSSPLARERMVFNAPIGNESGNGSATGVISVSLTQHPTEVPHGLCDRCVVLGAGGVLSVFDAGEESLTQAKALFSKPFGEIEGVDAAADGRPVLVSASPGGRCLVVSCRGGSGGGGSGDSSETRLVVLGCGLLPHEEKLPAKRREKARLGPAGKRPATGADADWAVIARVAEPQRGGVVQISWLPDSTCFLTRGGNSRHVRVWRNPLC